MMCVCVNVVVVVCDMLLCDDGGDVDDVMDVECVFIVCLLLFLRCVCVEDVVCVVIEVFGIGVKVVLLMLIEDVVWLLVWCEMCGRVVFEDGFVMYVLRRCDGGVVVCDANANASASAKNKANAMSECGGGVMGERKVVGRVDRGMGRMGVGGVGCGVKFGG